MMVLMEVSCKEDEHLRELNSVHGKAKLHRASNTMKEASVELKSVAYKTLWEWQSKACSNIIALVLSYDPFIFTVCIFIPVTLSY